MEQLANELLAPARHPRYFQNVVVAGADRVWAVDLAEMQEWKDSNDGERYILCCVDVFSRYAWARPLKNKTAAETLAAFKLILEEAGRKPDRVWSDQGGEFAKLKSTGVKQYSTYGEAKAATAEAFVKTLKHRLWHHFLTKQTRRWVGAAG